MINISDPNQEPETEHRLLIRRSCQKSENVSGGGEPYYFLYEQSLPRIEQIDIDNVLVLEDTAENRQRVNHQLNLAEPQSLVKSLNDENNATETKSGNYTVHDQQGNNYAIKKTDGYKIFVIGESEPQLQSGNTLTRLYITLDPTRSTDGFVELVKQLRDKSLLSDIQLCLNLEELAELKVPMNAVVIYITNSNLTERADLITKIMTAYQKAKSEKPELFEIGENRRWAIIASYFRSLKLFLDQNLSFLEMPTNESYDASGRQVIEDALQISQATTHQDRIRTLREKQNSYVWSWKSNEKIRKSILKPGDELESIRNLSVPALVERRRWVCKIVEGKLRVLPI